MTDVVEQNHLKYACVYVSTSAKPENVPAI